MRQLKITQQITNRDAIINKYFEDVTKFESITPDQELELAERIKQGDMEAHARLVEANLRFVISVAKQYQGKGMSLHDLIQYGNEGCCKAAHRFDSSRGFKFISYAVWWIRQSILTGLSDANQVHIPLNRITESRKILAEQERLIAETGMNIDTIAAGISLGIDSKRVIQNNVNKTLISINKPIGNEDDITFENSAQIATIPDESSIGVNKAIDDILKKVLDAREYRVIRYAYGFHDGREWDYHDISIAMILSPERVRQIRVSGIKKLQRAVKNHPSVKVVLLQMIQ
jgi:RNA polymerase primary sigma factor